MRLLRILRIRLLDTQLDERIFMDPKCVVQQHPDSRDKGTCI